MNYFVLSTIPQKRWQRLQQRREEFCKKKLNYLCEVATLSFNIFAKSVIRSTINS